MCLPDYNSPSSLKAILDENALGMQKKFGQNFLINGAIRNQLTEALEISAGEKVWEVGPGLGAMTKGILEKGADLTVFEIDRGFIQLLKKYFGDCKNFKIIEGDVIKTLPDEAEKNGAAKKFLSNLPYNIAAVLIASSIEKGIFFDKMAVTVQKEVGQRMSAEPGSRDYSSFSVLCSWAYEVKPLRTIPPAAFWPKPNVDSLSLVLTKRCGFVKCKNTVLFSQIVRSLFHSRRKTVKNNLLSWIKTQRLPKEKNEALQSVLVQAGLKENLRAENLTVNDFLKLTCLIDGIMERK